PRERAEESHGSLSGSGPSGLKDGRVAASGSVKATGGCGAKPAKCFAEASDSHRDALSHAHAYKSFGIRTYEKCFRKSFGMRSCKIIGLKVPWNEHLQKNWGGGGASLKAVATSQDNLAAPEGEKLRASVRMRQWPSKVKSWKRMC